MHDGRLSTIEDVVNHYSQGIKESNTTDSLLVKTGFNFSQKEKDDLILFLKTLTDDNFVSRNK
jgi:cytochrome c peroxidase